MADSFRTISEQSEGIYTEKRSKFLAFALPIANEEEAKEHIQNFRKQYYDARHVCYAYALGTEGERTRANDDGEPSGTAGKPILGQIRSLALSQILVVVVRYFGGVKLGTGGLAMAYKQAAFEALSAAHIVEQIVTESLRVAIPYAEVDILQRLVKPTGAEITQRNYEATHTILTYSIRKSQTNELRRAIEQLYTAQIIEDETH
ncbi:MAG: YigZ family protein [Bacteroidaceae bacterium]|nr:YigZ family protein [Bacteroidaceae bacterium]